MKEKSLSTDEVFVITKIEHLISNFYNDPENIFKKILELTDEHKIAKHKEIMNYFFDLLVSKGFTEYADELAKKYNIQ
jgi:hypothetical protein